jgi:putative acetyltransferase
MSATPTIRPYRATDRAATALVYYRAVREGTTAHYTDAQRAAWAPRATPDLSKPHKLLGQWAWVAEENGQITGFMSLCHDGLLDMAFVLPEVMGTGTATALYAALIAKARAERLPRLTVEASPYSHGFLRKHGWQVDWQGERMFDGIAFFGYHMSLELDQTPPTV